VALAGRGIASLTIDNPEQRTAEGTPRPRPWDADAARADRARLVVDARRGLDLLAAPPEVDGRRLALVGHSLGFEVGAAVAALDGRVTAAVLMTGFAAETAYWSAGEGRLPVTFRGLLGPGSQRAFLDAIAPYDSIRFLPKIAPRPFLVQFARRGESVAPWDAQLSILAAGDRATVEWFDTEHILDAAAQASRDAWLVRVLAAR